MKKLFLLLAIALLTLKGYAQNNTFTKSAMVILVSEAKKTFAKGTNYNDWVKSLIGGSLPTTQEKGVLQDVYGYLSTNQNPESIFKNYDGASLLALGRTKNSMNAFTETAARCGFTCWFIGVIIWIHVTLGTFEPNINP